MVQKCFENICSHCNQFQFHIREGLMKKNGVEVSASFNIGGVKSKYPTKVWNVKLSHLEANLIIEHNMLI